jgi:hypothetical protein
MRSRFFLPIFAIFFVVTLPSQSVASSSDGELFSAENSRAARMWRLEFNAPTIALDATAVDFSADQQRTQAVTYSDAYNTRRKIHMWASYATLPLFVAQYVSGQQLYDGKEGGLADAHGALAGAVATLFGVNTVTGVWNLWEARSDPNGKTRRIVHGLLMLGADAGFVATGMLAPGDDEGSGGKSTHRTVAVTSMGVATAGYLYMLFTR